MSGRSGDSDEPTPHRSASPRVAGVNIGPSDVHGGNRRPGREFTVDPAALAEYNRGVERARRAYRERPNACTAKVWKRPGGGK